MTWSLIDQDVGRYKMKQAIKILGKILGLTLAISSAAQAQGLEEFYRGRNVQVIIPNATG